MTSQASLDVAVNDTIDPAWGDEVRAHLITTETATPATVFEGKVYCRTDADELIVHDGTVPRSLLRYGQWGSIPVITATQGGLISTSAASAEYTVMGRFVVVTFAVTFSGAGSASNAINVNLNLTLYSGTPRRTGTATGIYNFTDSGTTQYSGPLFIDGGTYNLSFYRDGDLNPLGGGVTVASGDAISGTFVYERT